MAPRPASTLLEIVTYASRDTYRVPTPLQPRPHSPGVFHAVCHASAMTPTPRPRRPIVPSTTHSARCAPVIGTYSSVVAGDCAKAGETASARLLSMIAARREIPISTRLHDHIDYEARADRKDPSVAARLP